MRKRVKLCGGDGGRKRYHLIMLNKKEI